LVVLSSVSVRFSSLWRLLVPTSIRGYPHRSQEGTPELEVEPVRDQWSTRSIVLTDIIWSGLSPLSSPHSALCAPRNQSISARQRSSNHRTRNTSPLHESTCDLAGAWDLGGSGRECDRPRPVARPRVACTRVATDSVGRMVSVQVPWQGREVEKCSWQA
jgi:hypothetical protein